jgi:hypothetical protein
MAGERTSGAERADLSTGAGRRVSRSASRARGVGFGLVAAIALCCCTLLTPAAADAATPGQISGTVTVAGGGFAANTEVCAFGEAVTECASTNGLGEYTIEELEAGEYVVEFTGREQCTSECARPYARQYYDGAPEEADATRIAISAGQTRSGVDAVLQPGAVIEGRVESEGKPVASTEVCAFDEAGEWCKATNTAGEYEIEGLPEGGYTVAFGGQICLSNQCTRPYVLQYYEGASEESNARTLAVRPGTRISNVDASLEPGHSIAGTVQSQQGAVADMEVCAEIAHSNTSQQCAETSSSGEYEIEGLAEGEYTVIFTGRVCAPGSSCTQPYLYHETTSVMLTGHGSNATGIDATLEAAASIAGTVRAAGGAPVSNTRVCAESQSLEAYQCAETNAAGEYLIEGLQAGQYTVEFTGELCPEDRGEAECGYPYAAQFYNDASERGHAQPLTLTTGQNSTGIGATLTLGGQIDGTVTNAAIGKAPVAGLEVCASDRSGSVDRCARTNSAGVYAIEGLPSGSYVVEFEGEVCGEHGCADDYLTQYYEGTGEEADAKPVEVLAPNAVTGIDASVSEANPKAPATLTAPTLTGSAAVGATLQCSEGSFSNNPTRLAYEWLRDGAPIPGATTSAYVVATADEGQTLACEVSALNVAGSASARSNSLAIPAKPTPTIPAKPTPTTPTVSIHGSAVARGTATEKKGTVLLQLICTGSGPCSGDVVLVASVTEKRGKHHRSKVEKITIGKASFSLAAGAKQTLRVKLTAKGNALIASAREHSATVELSGSDLASRLLIIKAVTEKKKQG